MLNTVLATLAAVIWSSSYVLYFRREILRWWRTRHHRRARAAIERERAIAAYAAWVRNMPQPAPRMAPVPVGRLSTATLLPARTAVVVPFPRGGRMRRRSL